RQSDADRFGRELCLIAGCLPPHSNAVLLHLPPVYVLRIAVRRIGRALDVGAVVAALRAVPGVAVGTRAIAAIAGDRIVDDLAADLLVMQTLRRGGGSRQDEQCEKDESPPHADAKMTL